MKRIDILFAFLFVLLAAAGCTKKTFFSEYKTIDKNGWKKDSVAVFDVAVSDTIGVYDVIVNIRNKNEYPYQNLYLFITSTSPSDAKACDTLNCILADNQGHWYGSGIGSMSTLPILYMSKIKFPEQGNYHFEIKQGMRESVLQGVSDIGLHVKLAEDEQK
jgi:gliding motility-associated lipoprotein GldH